MSEKPIFIKTHPNDGTERVLNLNHVVEARVSKDGLHAEVKMIGEDKFIRTDMFYSNIKEYLAT